MVENSKIWMANTQEGEHICLLPKMANRHGLIAGATGTGKTITLKVMAESFSEMGVPVFLADVKGDIAGMIRAGEDSANMQERISRFGLAEAGFTYQSYSAVFWDVYGEKGIQLRTTISEMGPLLLSRILGLNETQTSILTVAFKIADDENLLLVDTKDLKALLAYVSENRKEYSAEYGNMSTQSINTIVRSIVALESDGGEKFFGEPGLNIADLFAIGEGGKGVMNILDSQSLINNGKLYSTFLLWLLSEMFETLPEVGDLEKPRMVFFFDEAHLLFDNCSQDLMDKIEQVVKLIRSKGIGVYFVTQNPADIPGGVLAQLGNKVQHGLRAYTPAEQKGIKAAAESFRVNPEFDTADAIKNLGTAQAVISFLQEDGTPGVVTKADVLPPKSLMGGIGDGEREQCIKASMQYIKYYKSVDPDSAYEFLQRRGVEKAQEELEAAQARDAQKAAQKQAEYEAKQEAKAAERAAKEAEKEKQKAATARKRAVKNVGSAVAGTVGREVGKEVGKGFGKFGKTIGGNVGASLGRGILSTLFKM